MISFFFMKTRVAKELLAELDGERKHRQKIHSEKLHADAMVQKLKDEMDALLVRHLAEPEKRIWLRSPSSLAPADLKAAFDVENKAPLWVAVHQVLDEEIQRAIDEATAEPSPSCTAEHRTFRNGGIDYLRRLQKELLDRQEEAQKADEDLDPAKEKL